MRALFSLLGPGASGFGRDRKPARQEPRARPSSPRRPGSSPGSSSASFSLGGRSPSPAFARRPNRARGRDDAGRTAVSGRSSGLPVRPPSSVSMNALIPNQPLMAQSLGGAFVLDMAIQLVGWAAAATLQTEKFYDLFGSLAFASTAITSFVSSPQAPRQALITGMVCAWTARLGAFLARRVLRDGGDSRFDEVKRRPGMFLVYWLIQGAWVWVTALPCFLINGLTSQSGLHAGDYVSLALWLFGIAIETAADVQKSAFKADPTNRGRFIDVGLWSVSRHPNYFGEILVWLGVCGVALSANASVGVSVAALASPAFVTLLLTKVSGIPILEKSADERWGSEAKYQEYKRNTPCLVPRLPGLGSAKAV